MSVPSELNLSKTTFLVADGKAMYREMVQTALLGAGAKSVKHATSVDKAIETLNRYGQEISCVICDWDMEPVGGLELLRMIRCRTLPKTSPRTPVVILTARADANAVNAAMALDVNGFAVAPLSFEKLVKTIAAALTRTWDLHEPSQYAAVPRIEAHNRPPEARVHTGKEPTRHDPQQQHARKAAAHSEATAVPRANKLINIHMTSLANVRPGDILARDLHDKDGQLLLSAGATLKQAIIDRLLGVAGGHADSYHMWIGTREDATEEKS
jgi:DNA-binding NarL/FixJ family response regulator